MAHDQRWPESVRVFEVGPRDGLQNEPDALPLATRREFVDRLVTAGLTDIEVGSFVHPHWAPQMADTDALVPRLPAVPGVRYWALVPNQRGFERALAAGARRHSYLASASEAHARKNLNKSIADALAEVEKLADAAARQGIPWRGYVSVAFGCPFEGAVDFDVVMDLARRMTSWGAAQISFGDTIGVGGPLQIRDAARRVLDEFGPEKVAFHLHDTQGLGLSNTLVALEEGVRTFDSSVGGIGGCPYAPGAAGNLATEDLVHLLDALGVHSGVHLAKLTDLARWLEDQARVRVHSRYSRYVRTQLGV